MSEARRARVLIGQIHAIESSLNKCREDAVEAVQVAENLDQRIAVLEEGLKEALNLLDLEGTSVAAQALVERLSKLLNQTEQRVGGGFVAYQADQSARYNEAKLLEDLAGDEIAKQQSSFARKVVTRVLEQRLDKEDK